MSWTYTSAPSTSSSAGRRDAVRWLMNDRFTSRQLVQDALISFSLSQEGNNIYRAAALNCDALADSEAVTARVGDFTLGGEKPKNYRELARTLRRISAERGAKPFIAANSSMEKSLFAIDTDRVIPAFTRGMMTKPGTIVGTTSTGF